MLKENHDKDDDMDLTKIESIHEVNEKAPFRFSLRGTDIREVVIDIGDFSFDALLPDRLPENQSCFCMGSPILITNGESRSLR